MRFPKFCYTGKKRPVFFGSWMLGKKSGERIRFGHYPGIYEILDEKTKEGDTMVIEYNWLGSILSLLMMEK